MGISRHLFSELRSRMVERVGKVQKEDFFVGRYFEENMVLTLTNRAIVR